MLDLLVFCEESQEYEHQLRPQRGHLRRLEHGAPQLLQEGLPGRKNILTAALLSEGGAADGEKSDAQPAA